MTVARFGPFKVTGSDGRAVPVGTPIHVVKSDGVTAATIFSDDAGTTEITGQQEAFVPDATGKTSGSEGTTTTHGIVLTDEDSNITFVATKGDYFLVIPSDENPLAIEIGNTASNSFAETVNVKAGNVSVANNVDPPGTEMPSAMNVTLNARVGTAPATTPVIVRINKNGVAVGSIKIAPAATSQAGVQAGLAGTACTGAVAGTNTLVFTVGTGHGVLVGETVEITGFTPSAYNGTWQVSAVGSTTITVTDTGATSGTPANATVFGVIKRGIPVPLAVAQGDVLTYDVTVIGTTTVGADLAIDIAGS